MLSGIGKKLTDKLMSVTIKHYIKERYFKKSVHPTVEQVMMDLNREKLDTLLQQGYTEEEIREMVEIAIERKK